ncbi:GMC family oxidoreductase [Solimonas terrae]|nr:GMC family oxidoreductase [Solimonas terrae]
MRLQGDQPLTPGQWLRHLHNVVRDPLTISRFLWHWLRHRTLAQRKYPSIIVAPKSERYSLDFHCEQQPNRDSRVTLGADRDAFGMPRLRVDWRYADGDVNTVRRAIALLAHELRRSGAGEFEYDPEAVEAEMTRYGAYGGHHIGTARMGNDPRSSVVDANACVHGMDNLFIASAAVFPTSSQANPTLTVVALALRLAERLKVLHARQRTTEFRASALQVSNDTARDSHGASVA